MQGEGGEGGFVRVHFLTPTNLNSLLVWLIFLAIILVHRKGGACVVRCHVWCESKHTGQARYCSVVISHPRSRGNKTKALKKATTRGTTVHMLLILGDLSGFSRASNQDFLLSIRAKGRGVPPRPQNQREKDADAKKKERNLTLKNIQQWHARSFSTVPADADMSTLVRAARLLNTVMEKL